MVDVDSIWYEHENGDDSLEFADFHPYVKSIEHAWNYKEVLESQDIESMWTAHLNRECRCCHWREYDHTYFDYEIEDELQQMLGEIDYTPVDDSIAPIVSRLHDRISKLI